MRRKGALERAHSAGVREPTLARGACASSSALLEEQGPVRRSSAGTPLGLARQRSGRRPGSKSPTRTAQAGLGEGSVGRAVGVEKAVGGRGAWSRAWERWKELKSHPKPGLRRLQKPFLP